MEQEQSHHFEQPRRITIPLVISLFCAGALIVGLWVRDRQQMEAIDAEHARATAALNQALDQSKLQIQALNNRIDAMSQPRPEPVKAAPARIKKVTVTARRRPAVRIANDPRVDRLQGQLADTQTELARTRDDISKTRDDLGKTRDDVAKAREDLARTRDDVEKGQQEIYGRINSARDDLNGSIARTHEEVVALRKRGEQNIYEFRLDRSKQFQKVGPLGVSLRGTNPKHKTFDMAMMIEDNEISKKHVNLFEPVWIRLSDRAQPVELVVNRVDKNRIAGYLSEPKYRKSELASTSEKPAEKPQQLVSR